MTERPTPTALLTGVFAFELAQIAPQCASVSRARALAKRLRLGLGDLYRAWQTPPPVRGLLQEPVWPDVELPVASSLRVATLSCLLDACLDLLSADEHAAELVTLPLRPELHGIWPHDTDSTELEHDLARYTGWIDHARHLIDRAPFPMR